jgi:hypothetical protein
MISIISGENAASAKFLIGDLGAEEVQRHSFASTTQEKIWSSEGFELSCSKQMV